MPASPVSVTIGREHYTSRITAGKHQLWGDEPASAGGADQGPTPYDLLLASLGTCTAITLRMYADRKEWPLERVSVELEHERIHAQDCEECEQREGMATRITRRLTLEGDLTTEQRRRLLEIADKCPVHKTLSHEIRITTTAVAAAR